MPKKLKWEVPKLVRLDAVKKKGRVDLQNCENGSTPIIDCNAGGVALGGQCTGGTTPGG